MRKHPPEVRKQARILREKGEIDVSIARQLGVSANTVRRWLSPDVYEKSLLQSRLYKATKQRRGVCIDCGGPTNWSKEKPSERCRDCRLIWLEDNPRWSRESVIAAIKRWVEEYGRPPRSHEWKNRGEWWPSLNSVYGERGQPFHTWRGALQAAGYDTPPHTHNNPGPYGRRWSVEEAARLRREGLPDHKIGEQFGVSGSAIFQALGRREPKPNPVAKKRTREQRIEDLRKALARQKGEHHEGSSGEEESS